MLNMMSAGTYMLGVCFFFNDTATTEIYTLSLHDALPIYLRDRPQGRGPDRPVHQGRQDRHLRRRRRWQDGRHHGADPDRKSTRLNSSHANISYAVFCLKKKNTTEYSHQLTPSSRTTVTTQ